MKLRLILIGVVLSGAALLAVFVWRSQPAHEVVQPPINDSLYVALGDSVTSGLGLAPPADSSGCGRSKAAYPYQLGVSRGYEVVHLACSGATLEAGINGPQIAAGEQVSQRELLFQREPDLITLGIGANDVRWLSLLAQCLERACGGSEDRAAYEQLLRNFSSQLRSTLEAIEARYGNDTRLLVIGYYQVFPKPGTTCDDVAGLDAQELSWGRELRAQLNETVADTVGDAGYGTYVEVDFSGHELCGAAPWIQGLADPAPYHANVAGQQAIAEQIEKALQEE